MTLRRISRSLSRPASISLDAYDDRILRATWQLSLDFTRKSRVQRDGF